MIVVNGIIVLYFGFEGSQVDTELSEPIEESHTGAGEGPIDNNFKFVEEGDGCVDSDGVVVNKSSSGHEGIETFDLFVAVFDLESRQVEVDEVEESKGYECSAGTVEIGSSGQ